jgi:N-methylhydantoinase B/oxoprolinase/acetone carboxylase alpha subunit
VAREGVICDELLRLFFRNSRFPEMVKGDTRASMAAIRLGERRLASCSALRPARHDDLRALIAETEREVRASCARWCRRAARLHRHHRQRRPGHRPIKLRYRLDVTADA